MIEVMRSFEIVSGSSEDEQPREKSLGLFATAWSHHRCESDWSIHAETIPYDKPEMQIARVNSLRPLEQKESTLPQNDPMKADKAGQLLKIYPKRDTDILVCVFSNTSF